MHGTNVKITVHLFSKVNWVLLYNKTHGMNIFKITLYDTEYGRGNAHAKCPAPFHLRYLSMSINLLAPEFSFKF
jgi:hypothetical protein